MDINQHHGGSVDVPLNLPNGLETPRDTRFLLSNTIPVLNTQQPEWYHDQYRPDGLAPMDRNVPGVLTPSTAPNPSDFPALTQPLHALPYPSNVNYGSAIMPNLPMKHSLEAQAALMTRSSPESTNENNVRQSFAY